MAETTTFVIYVRIGSNGQTASVTSAEVEAGTTLGDVWGEDDDVQFTDHVIEVTATLPLALDERVSDATVTLAEPPQAAISATEAA